MVCTAAVCHSPGAPTGEHEGDGRRREAWEVPPGDGGVVRRQLVRDAAATDPDMRSLAQRLERSRHRRMTSNARALADRGLLRPGVSTAEAADVMYVVTSAELYELLVMRRRWSVARFGEYVRRNLTVALLP